MKDYKDSYEYDDDVTGVIKGVEFNLGPTTWVRVWSDDSGEVDYEDLPTPEGEDYEDFWSQFVGRRVRVRESRKVSVEVLS